MEINITNLCNMHVHRVSPILKSFFKKYNKKGSCVYVRQKTPRCVVVVRRQFSLVNYN